MLKIQKAIVCKAGIKENKRNKQLNCVHTKIKMRENNMSWACQYATKHMDMYVSNIKNA